MTPSAWLLVLVYLPAVAGLLCIGRRKPRVGSLFLIPLAVVILYVWIGVTDPDIEQARAVLRQVLISVGAYVDYIVAAHIIDARRRHE